MVHSKSKNYRTFLVEGNFAFKDQSILDIVDYLDTATEKDKANIIFKDHRGGHLQTADLFIEAVENSHIGRIVIIFERFAISAAAFIYAYFVYYASSSKVIVRTNHPLCIVYHKPRMTLNKMTIFSNFIINPHKKDKDQTTQYLIDRTSMFDDVFEAMWRAIQETFNIAPHVKDVYNNNGDVSFVFSKGIQSYD